MRVTRVLAVRLFVVFILSLLALSAGLAACGTANSITASSSTVTSDSATTGELRQQGSTPQTLPAADGWTIKLIPGTDKMRVQYDQIPTAGGGASNETWSPPAPPTFEPSVAIEGNRVVYSAFYDKRPQVYLYDIASGTVTQLTHDAADPQTAYGEQVQVQISGDLVAWQRGYNDQPIYLHNLATGATKQFQPHNNFTSWRLTGGRLAWAEGIEPHGAQLHLYDPAVGSPQTIASAHGLLGFTMDDKHIAWTGGAGTRSTSTSWRPGRVRRSPTSPSGRKKPWC
jgi:hypothetical protein